MTDELKSRLRKLEGGDKYGSTVWHRNPDGPEAADYIEKLELIEKAYQQNQQTWSRNIARIEKLEAALREIAFARPECCAISDAMQYIARKALNAK